MESNFERCPHDSENPYVIINRNLARNSTLSFQARGFLIYLLSHSGKWKINREFIMKSQGIGKDRLKSIVNELVKEGFLRIEKNRNANGTFCVTYLVSEFPKFSKNVYQGGLTAAENPPRSPYKKKEELKNIKPPTPLKRGQRLLRIDKNKQWAKKHEYTSQCGYAIAELDRYVIVSGSFEEIHYYKDRNDPFWNMISEKHFKSPLKASNLPSNGITPHLGYNQRK